MHGYVVCYNNAPGPKPVAKSHWYATSKEANAAFDLRLSERWFTVVIYRAKPDHTPNRLACVRGYSRRHSQR